MGGHIQIRGWGWRYAGRRHWACRGIDLDIEAGERVLLVGSSGAGKSTLLRAAAGLLDPDTAAEQEGHVLIDGQPAAQARGRIGMLLQDPEAALVMSRAGDDVAFGLENAGVARDEIWPRVDHALQHVGFEYGRERPTAALSGGEQQRLALAGALVRRPSILLLDEPTANLDPAGTRLVLDAVRGVIGAPLIPVDHGQKQPTKARIDAFAHDQRERGASGATLVIVEHRVDLAVELVDRVVVLEPGGGVLEDGRPQEVFGRRGAALAAAGVWVPAPWAPPSPVRRRGPGGATRLRADRVSRSYPNAARMALEPSSVELAEGQATCVVGPNGSGKSTLATILAGLVRPDTGGSYLADVPDRPLHRWRAQQLCRRVGTVFQDPEHQFLAPTVQEELMIGPRRAGMPTAAAQRRCAELLSRLRLDRLAGANPYTLSGGEKRRLSVSTALATAPDVLVLDEPTFGQDAQTWQELISLCAELRDNGTTILSVTHDEPFADVLADQRITVRDGTVSLADAGRSAPAGPTASVFDVVPTSPPGDGHVADDMPVPRRSTS
ncbi:ATP-binding cassette domain-containing protein [Phytoactinopolyspora sp. XMNu-373]|uniref:ATP-binding cassette domain-containing protein n=2 Tax=Phytoactinopolyspora mesophila TaxID=2650750 RepID=A0A7K3M2A1_9ACTN|nr:ATP-binding cassette domain-containing protein [Phytoactinopolyspora mesophila]